jgi:hypothetical protein
LAEVFMTCKDRRAEIAALRAEIEALRRAVEEMRAHG